MNLFRAHKELTNNFTEFNNPTHKAPTGAPCVNLFRAHREFRNKPIWGPRLKLLGMQGLLL